jgi:aspartate ammonia-lyase
MRYRTEKDLMGKVNVPSDAYYGIFTVRAEENFPVSGMRINRELNNAIVLIKLCAAFANVEEGNLDKKIGSAIVKSCRKILRGEHDDQFIVDVFQAGAGTPWHMNVNEVVANVASEMLGKDFGYINAHDHVNRGQSTNDVMPSALRIACLKLSFKLVRSLEDFVASLRRKSFEFDKVIKVGRTHYMDAVPITLGKEFGAWASSLENRIATFKKSLEGLKNLSLGGSAIGTGVNVSKKFSRNVVRYLQKETEIDFTSARDKVEKTQFMTDFLDVSSALRSIAVDIGKVCKDIRLLSSGPTAGLNEIKLPKVEPGSSIMPGKFNPSMAEMLNMVCYQVIGSDFIVGECASSGELELNVMTPIMAHNLLSSLEILRKGVVLFDKICVRGVEANRNVMRAYFERDPIIATVLNNIIGYEKAGEVVKASLKSGRSIKQTSVELGYLTQREAERVFSEDNFTE